MNGLPERCVIINNIDIYPSDKWDNYCLRTSSLNLCGVVIYIMTLLAFMSIWNKVDITIYVINIVINIYFVYEYCYITGLSHGYIPLKNNKLLITICRVFLSLCIVSLIILNTANVMITNTIIPIEFMIIIYNIYHMFI